jgi:hypothetical protein
MAAACVRPPPPPVTHTADVQEPKAPEPKPPPKCEDLAEQCAAAATTRARIGHTGLAFAPPAGWTYAQGDDVTVARGPDAAMAFTTYEKGKGPQHLLSLMHAALDRLIAKMGLDPIAKKPFWWQKPTVQTEKVADLRVSFWQVDGGARGGKRGPLLIFSAPLSDGTTLLGAGYVPSDDKTNADQAILSAVQTITRDSPADFDDAGAPNSP